MIFTGTKLAGAFVIEIEPRTDERGFFARSFCEHEFAAHGLPVRFPQCNLSRNVRSGTLRGMHYQAAPYGEAKLVRCCSGSIYDVIVDLRRSSATYLEWFGIELSAESARALFVPEGLRARVRHSRRSDRHFLSHERFLSWRERARPPLE